MCRRRIIVFVVFMLILVLEATPWHSRIQKITSQAVTTRRFIKTYTRPKSNGHANLFPMATPSDTGFVMNPAEMFENLPASITLIDNLTGARTKEPILHKAHKKTDFSTKPLEIDGILIGGINDWFLLDDFFNEYYTDEDHYEYYKEYIEEYWEEITYELDEDDYEDPIDRSITIA